ncbi:MAG TPA: hypothetical protein VNA87_04015 [Actinomycetota bacterium]|nr:hypothetical protein [Actinomycetota bacterium]
MRRATSVFRAIGVPLILLLLLVSCRDQAVQSGDPMGGDPWPEIFEFQGFEIPLYNTWKDEPCSYPRTHYYKRSLHERSIMGEQPTPPPASWATLTVRLGATEPDPGSTCEGRSSEMNMGAQATRAYGGLDFLVTPYAVGGWQGFSWYQDSLDVILDYRCNQSEEVCRGARQEVGSALNKIGRWFGCWESHDQARKLLDEALNPNEEIVDARVTMPPTSVRYIAAEMVSGEVGVWEYWVDGNLYASDSVSAKISKAKRARPDSTGSLGKEGADKARECVKSKADPRRFHPEADLF